MNEFTFSRGFVWGFCFGLVLFVCGFSFIVGFILWWEEIMEERDEEREKKGGVGGRESR